MILNTDRTTDSYAYSIAVSGSDVYVAGKGKEYNNNYPNGTNDIAKYWKNGSMIKLTDGSNTASANLIAISGSDLFVAGYESNATNYLVAKYWKNGSAVVLSDGSNNAQINAIAIAGSDIYMAGNDGNYATYWKNGTVVKLSDGSNAASGTCITIVQ